VAVGEIVRYKHATRTVNRVTPIDDNTRRLAEAARREFLPKKYAD